METTHLLRHTVSAGHVLKECGDRPHGHDYLVEVAVREFPNLTDVLVVEALAEIHNRNLAEMLPGIPPTCAGIAGWLFERLRMQSKVTKVTVWQSNSIGAEVTETEV